MGIPEAIVLFFAILFVAYFLGVIRGAPFLPSNAQKVREIIAALDIKPGDKFADLGSGDGRLVMAAAEAGAAAKGFEINPILVLWSRYRLRQAGLSGKAIIYWKSFWQQDLSEFNRIAIFGIDTIMEKLGSKLKAELRPGSAVVCYIFPLPGWPTETAERGVYKYVVV